MPTVTASFLEKLTARRADEYRTCEQLLLKAKREGRDRLTEDEDIAHRAHVATLKALDEHIADTRSELARMGSFALKDGASAATR